MFCVVLYRSSFVLFGPFPFVIMLSVLRFVVFDYLFGIIKLFFNMITDILFSGFLFILLIMLCNISNYLRCEKKSLIYPHVHPQYLVVSVLLIFLVFLCCAMFCLFSSCVTCVQCCQYLLIVHRFSLTFIYIINIEVLTSFHKVAP